MTEKSAFVTVDIVGTGCSDAQVLGNSRPPQPPHVSEGQSGTSESQGAADS